MRPRLELRTSHPGTATWAGKCADSRLRTRIGVSQESSAMIGTSTNCNCSLCPGGRNDQESEAVDAVDDGGRTPREIPADHQIPFRVIVNIDSNDSLPRVLGAANCVLGAANSGNIGGMPMPLYNLFESSPNLTSRPRCFSRIFSDSRLRQKHFTLVFPPRAGTTGVAQSDRNASVRNRISLPADLTCGAKRR